MNTVMRGLTKPLFCAIVLRSDNAKAVPGGLVKKRYFDNKINIRMVLVAICVCYEFSR